jgi:hypothetical protein
VRHHNAQGASGEVGDDGRPPGVVGGHAPEVEHVVSAYGNAAQEGHAPPAIGGPPAAGDEEAVGASDREPAQVDAHELVAAGRRGVFHPRTFVVAPCLLHPDDVGVEGLDRGDDIERPSVRPKAGVSVEGGEGE